ncbi:MAG: class I SAM-dependent methyltransferase, partial [Desulfobulbaceae bacterium]|nr:class I SAM-dependent methyltransferase [Desulfobulbaceae bacterium]
KKTGPVFVDFISGALAFRRKHGGGRKQDLGRAAGLKGNRCPTVIDATGGLARDAFILAALGCKVTLIERSPVIGALVEDGLKRAATDPEVAAIVNRLQLLIGDSTLLLNQITEEERPEVIYLDPMYPHRSKSALVKKEMRILRMLVGDDPDAPKLLAAALATAKERVVVKRPIKAEPITGPAPNMAITGKTGRFDVYLIRP